MEMRGWVALGNYLATRNDQDSGFDLLVLESICDRNNFNRQTVFEMLMQFADPHKTEYSQIALAAQQADSNGSTRLQALEHIQTKLHDMYKLTIRIKPMDGSMFQIGHATTKSRMRGYFHDVIERRIKSIRYGTPPATPPIRSI